MTLKGDSRRYGALLIALHWTSAVAILALLVLGFAAANTSDQALEASLLRFHVPLGVLTFALTCIRIAWWFFDRRPKAPQGQPRWQSATAHAIHRLLYLVTVVMGASGIGLLILSGAGAVLFFASPGPLPDFTAFRPMTAHAIGAFAMVGLLCIHTGAALYHQFVRRDRLFSRMGLGSVERA